MYKKSAYSSDLSESFEFTISISVSGLKPIFFNVSSILSCLPTKIGIPKPSSLKLSAALIIFSSSPSAKTTLFISLFALEKIGCIISAVGSSLADNLFLYASSSTIGNFATPDFIAAFATAGGISLINLGSKGAGII